MRKITIILLTAAFVIGVLTATGCGSGKTTIVTDEGKAEISEEGNKIVTETGEGTTTTEVADELPTEEDLGVPIYPDSTYDKESSGSISTTTEEGTSKIVSATLMTDDSVNKVVAWYKDKLSGMPGFSDVTASSEGALFMVGDEAEGRIVAIDRNAQGKTEISIASRSGGQ
ncbi:MAG: hypothetical protein KKF41_15535 [Actinobacteria bacterium]|nr:hypothetical protein [Actinomycetota bacterium]MBU1943262.1 hypothetical protein [Actinomycetota bacterium]MBU2688989.1 hypothetical protein [Actinomycetota bacterium]